MYLGIIEKKNVYQPPSCDKDCRSEKFPKNKDYDIHKLFPLNRLTGGLFHCNFKSVSYTAVPCQGGEPSGCGSDVWTVPAVRRKYPGFVYVL